jgi:hypothetical protein
MAVMEDLVGEWMAPPEGGGSPIKGDDYINQVRSNCKLDLPNVVAEPEHDKVMVMICGGPTAKQFLEDIRKKGADDKYRIFCSNGTHDWLIENDIIPDYHFIIDPKESMMKYVTKPHKDVKYLIGSCCYPEVFKALKDYNVIRMMVFSGTRNNEGRTDHDVIKALFGNKEYSALEGGTMAGLRAMTLGNTLGYQAVEFYGFDSCFFEYDKDKKPIYYAYDKKRIENIMECKTDDGRIFETTPVFASQARQYIKWKHRLEWMKFIIHGDSFTSHIHKIDEAVMRPKHNKLITDYMLKMNEELFKENDFGVVGHEYAGQIAILTGQLVNKYGAITLLDYGCGKQTLEKVFPPIQNVTFKNYDPCIKELSATPEPADVVVCTDVLEHVEFECLDNVLDDLKRVTKKTCFCSICLTPADKNYSDGQNTHVTLLEYDIWYAKLRKRFHVVESDIKTFKGNHQKFQAILQAREIR